MPTILGFFFILWNPFNLALLISLGNLLGHCDLGSVTYNKGTTHKANDNWETLGTQLLTFRTIQGWDYNALCA